MITSCLKENESNIEWLHWDDKEIPFTLEAFKGFIEHVNSCFNECVFIPNTKISLLNEQETFIKIGLKFDQDCESFLLYKHSINDCDHYQAFQFTIEDFHYLIKTLKTLKRSVKNLMLKFRIEVLL